VKWCIESRRALGDDEVSPSGGGRMVMDYASANAGVCVVVSGRCDMGQTAIQAAKSLHTKFGAPCSSIELTTMIGVNDVSDELFSLADTDTMIA